MKKIILTGIFTSLVLSLLLSGCVHKYRFDIHHKISVDEDAVTRTAIAIVTAKIEAEKRLNAERDAIKDARRREEEERKNNAQIEKEQREAKQKEREEKIKLIAKGFADPAEALRYLENPEAYNGAIDVVDTRSLLSRTLGKLGVVKNKPTERYVINEKRTHNKK
jgi:hypothetical protein